ncbi:MAG: acetate kinase [Candidatus Aureabacteria bacterium]|nr:acetate kinase [Candidatus Auribacterota bacterium]
MKILVINSGSSSIKYELFNVHTHDEYTVLAKGVADRIGISGAYIQHKKNDEEEAIIDMDLPNHTTAIDAIHKLLVDHQHGVIENISEVEGVGHRVVHGGEDFTGSVLVGKQVIEAIKKNSELAPLHNPPNLLGIEATSKTLPSVPQVAVFDTAIHQTMPPKAYLYGLSIEQYKKYAIRRYGFHGTSHGYVSKKAAETVGKSLKELKIITCHLGNGGSITAFLDGKSVDTSMGFTPLEGIIMGTRCGDLDPFIPIYIMETQDMTHEEVNILMNKKGGLLALTGKRDMRDVLQEAKQGSIDAINGIEMYVYRIQKYIGAYAAAMNGVDVIVFTAGIGENSFYIREKILKNFSYLGLILDTEANNNNEIIISTEDSSIYAMAIKTNEELVIATETFDIISKKS